MVSKVHIILIYFPLNFIIFAVVAVHYCFLYVQMVQ